MRNFYPTILVLNLIKEQLVAAPVSLKSCCTLNKQLIKEQCVFNTNCCTSIPVPPLTKGKYLQDSGNDVEKNNKSAEFRVVHRVSEGR